MKVLVDENIPLMTVDRLRELGHNVKDIRGTSSSGLSDPDLWELAISQERLLITTDKGFTQYRAVPHHGILIVRLRQPNRHKIHQAVMQAMDQFAQTEWPGLLAVVRDRTMSTSRATRHNDS
jgi:predicted nuclease of predicted toxin-antitoxin system